MDTRDDTGIERRKETQRRFDRASERFDSVDFVHAATRDGLFARLEPIVIAPTTVVDLGAATGAATRRLAQRFKRARIIAVDLSHSMLERTRAGRRWRSRTSVVQADAAFLPFADQSIDVVFANMLLPFIDDAAPVLDEVSRVLRKEGLFLFATLGPDSLAELREAWNEAGSAERIAGFPDMHDIGDAAVRAGLRDPVLDVDRLSITYRSARALLRDLVDMGAAGVPHSRDVSANDIRRLRQVLKNLNAHRIGGLLELELELVYGHCWGSGAQAAGGEYRIAMSQIGRRRR